MNYFKLILAIGLLLTLLGCKQKIADNIVLEKGETRKVTYQEHSEGYEEYEYEEDVTLSLEEILELFDAMDWRNESFLYFPITPLNVLQIWEEGENRFIVEITNDSRACIYHQKYVSQQECKDIISAMFEKDTLNAEFLSDFYEVPVRTKTLDEIMKQKKNTGR
jgi:hypothetical protein